MSNFQWRHWLVSMLCVSATLHLPAQAFQVLPKISDADRQLAALGNNKTTDWLGQWTIKSALPKLKSPVHEAITLNALDCTANPSDELSCVTVSSVGKYRSLLYGVRWPDDPPFVLNRRSPPRLSDCDVRVTLRSTSQPKCWLDLFRAADKDAKQRLKANPDAPAFGLGEYMLYRSHFGDLQFFHSMAAHEGEPASSTLQRMKMWTQFLWGIANQQLPRDRFLRMLDIPHLGGYFPGDITATNLLASGIVEVRKDLDQVAMGALLHMVQDSFSQSHAARNPETGAVCEGLPRFSQPGSISGFYTYAGQEGSLHDHEDTHEALGLHTLQFSPNVVDASRAFLGLWQSRAPWTEAEKLFDCVFRLDDPQTRASAGPYVR